MRSIFSNIPTSDIRLIKDISNSLLSKYNMNIPCDPQIIANSEGYKVIFSTYDESVKYKISSYIMNDGVIYINEDLDSFDIIFSIAHELGIGVLNLNRNRVFNRKHCENIFSQDQTIDDLKATLFALNLLVSPSSIKKVLDWIYVDNSLSCNTRWESYSRALCIKEYILKYMIDNFEGNKEWY